MFVKLGNQHINLDLIKRVGPVRRAYYRSSGKWGHLYPIKKEAFLTNEERIYEEIEIALTLKDDRGQTETYEEVVAEWESKVGVVIDETRSEDDEERREIVMRMWGFQIVYMNGEGGDLITGTNKLDIETAHTALMAALNRNQSMMKIPIKSQIEFDDNGKIIDQDSWNERYSW